MSPPVSQPDLLEELMEIIINYLSMHAQDCSPGNRCGLNQYCGVEEDPAKKTTILLATKNKINSVIGSFIRHICKGKIDGIDFRFINLMDPIIKYARAILTITKANDAGDLDEKDAIKETEALEQMLIAACTLFIADSRGMIYIRLINIR
jgi:hypothetical protein